MENKNQYIHLGERVEAVQVTAAYYNGETFDGSPFSDLPSWLSGAYKVGIVVPMGGDKPYAEWRVQTDDGADIAVPGDWIVYTADGFLVATDAEFVLGYESVDSM